MIAQRVGDAGDWTRPLRDVTSAKRLRAGPSLVNACTACADNSASDDGAAVYNKLGTLQLVNVTIDDSYGVAVRASTGGNTRHVADSFLVVDRSGPEYAIAPGRLTAPSTMTFCSSLSTKAHLA